MTTNPPEPPSPIRLVDNPRRFYTWLLVTLLAVVAAFGIAVAALVSASGADEKALQRVAADGKRADFVTCQLGNRTRPQIALNTLVAIDGALRELEAPRDIRVAVARSSRDALSRELAPNGSAGARDCDGDGRVDDDDYPMGVGPLRILDPSTGLPEGARP